MVRGYRDDILDYAITAVLMTGFTAMISVATLGTQSPLAVIGMALLTVIAAFTVTPYAVAVWLNTNVNTLVNTHRYKH